MKEELQILGDVIGFASTRGGVSVLLTKLGDVWQFLQDSEKPEKLSFESKDQSGRIIKISAGGFHFLALNDKGKVWRWDDGEEEDDFMEEEQFYPDFGEEEQKMSPIEERPIAGGRFVGTQGLQVSEASRPKITNKNKPQQSRQPGGDSRN